MKKKEAIKILEKLVEHIKAAMAVQDVARAQDVESAKVVLDAYSVAIKTMKGKTHGRN